MDQSFTLDQYHEKAYFYIFEKINKIFNSEMSSVLSNGQLTVPDGLPAALESLARAVLKEQPTDLANFAATHFRVLLSQRSGKSKRSC